MHWTIKKILVLLFLCSFFISCSYLQKAQDRLQGRPEMEGSAIEEIADMDIDSDSPGSDSGRIEGLRTVHFELDSSRLTSAVKETLHANKAWMDSHPEVQRILLEGHCDPLGSEAYNVGLGERRAQSVFNYLKSIGLAPEKMSLISYGEEKLISETENSLNRRVNFVPQY